MESFTDYNNTRDVAPDQSRDASLIFHKHFFARIPQYFAVQSQEAVSAYL